MADSIFEDASISFGQLATVSGLRVAIEFGGASIFPGDQLRWCGKIYPPNEKVVCDRIGTLSIPNKSSADIVVKQRNPIDGIIQFDGVGPVPIGKNAVKHSLQ
ncbi:hypothetical protein LBMAG52_10040 [Planctomycetia bacterium]|nr:hypothetical protein LBMAG52_10040 [Planctomycetia bacterium]